MAGSAFFQDLVELAHEAVDVLELPVDRGKADIGDFVERLQALHDELADLFCRDLAVERILDGLFDLIGGALKLGREVMKAVKAL